ncbi:MAG TPA: family 43 glycosylhydrolase, partial [Chloroflexaceae bacterium]|nr:family 43 glycosylhydrolase [Chloroflexaceae bacterium]
IGVAPSPTSTGPWTHSPTPAVEPHDADCCSGVRRNVFDPEVLRTDGADYIYYGSYFGGVSVRQLSEDGLTSDPATQSNVAVANKYEGPEVIYRDGYYYLFVSATDCCRGPLTGYSVFVGRSTSPTGPFLDRDGIDLNDDEGPNEADPTTGRVGGTPVITMNGNRWVGVGHNTVFQDFDGQWWTIYHGIDRHEPFFADAVNIFPSGCGHEEQPPPADDRCGDLNKRPALLDPLDWDGGWPVLRGGLAPSDGPMPAPAAQPGDETAYRTVWAPEQRTRGLLPHYSDQFNRPWLDTTWSWVRPPAAGSYGIEGGTLRFNTQAADLFVASNNASVLTRPAPQQDYIVETRVRLDVPDEGCCFNFVQAGLVIYGDDDNFIKLTHVSIWNTRQTEFAKEEAPVPFGYPRYGNTVVGAPGEWTYLRIAVEHGGDEELYTAYTSLDGKRWTKGGTWAHSLGDDARIGLVSMGGSGFTANFDYVRVYRMR